MKWHPLAEQFEMMEGAEWDELKRSIKETEGVKSNPVLFRVLPDGTQEGLDGRQRYKACQELRITPEMKAVKVKDEDVARFITQRNLLRRHSTATQRRKQVAALRAAGESIRTIAASVGASVGTVARDIEESGAAEPAEVRGRNRRTYKKVNRKKAKENENGKPKFDWAAYERLFSPVVRVPDYVAQAYPEEKGGKEYRGALKALDNFTTIMTAWKKKLTTK